MTSVTELQKKRAENIIWNCADDYGFSPDFKAYDADGLADLYWNCIIGAARRHFDWEKIAAVLRSFSQYEDCDTYEGLMWLGLENCVYARELQDRPVLSSLRQNYARAFIDAYPFPDDYMLLDSLSSAHWQRVSGIEPKLSKYDKKLLDELEFPPDLSSDEIVLRAQQLFARWFQIAVEERKKSQRFRLPGLRKRRKAETGRYRKFGIGFSDHPEKVYGGAAAGDQGENMILASRLSAEELRAFIETKYGRPVFNPGRTQELERSLCSGNHKNCRLHFTDGVRVSDAEINNGFEAISRQREAAQVESNRAYYQEHIRRNRTAVSKLASNIRNSVLMHLEPFPVKACAGALNSRAVWRGAKLEDEYIFSRSENDSAGGLSVDILLDASTSQKYRQEIISTQAYIIASALDRCSIPCRVMSFCSMTGYTIVRIFREYAASRDNERIFEYVSNGCNRDGLAVRAVHRLLDDSPYEHRILIILSDVKPNDVIRMPSASSEESVAYEKAAGLNDTATEVRRARADGISVICIFTGDDEDLPSARTVYGSDFVRIRSFDRLADTVGALIQNQIRNI